MKYSKELQKVHDILTWFMPTQFRYVDVYQGPTPVFDTICKMAPKLNSLNELIAEFKSSNRYYGPVVRDLMDKTIDRLESLANAFGSLLDTGKQLADDLISGKWPSDKDAVEKDINDILVAQHNLNKNMGAGKPKFDVVQRFAGGR